MADVRARLRGPRAGQAPRPPGDARRRRAGPPCASRRARRRTAGRTWSCRGGCAPAPAASPRSANIPCPRRARRARRSGASTPRRSTRSTWPARGRHGHERRRSPAGWPCPWRRCGASPGRGTIPPPRAGRHRRCETPPPPPRRRRSPGGPGPSRSPRRRRITSSTGPISTPAAVDNTFNVRRHPTSASPRRAFRASETSTWRAAVAVA